MNSQGRIRIIAGRWRGTRVPVLHSPGLRPTPDRVRETLFNWIGNDIQDSVCLDLFAGTGMLGLEAASRGAARVWAVEREKKLSTHLQEQCHRLGANQVEVVCADALAWVKRAQEAMDYIFLDPPFGGYDFSQLLTDLEGSQLLKSTTVLYYECAVGVGQALADTCYSKKNEGGVGWERIHNARAGRVSYNLYQRP